MLPDSRRRLERRTTASDSLVGEIRVASWNVPKYGRTREIRAHRVDAEVAVGIQRHDRRAGHDPAGHGRDDRRQRAIASLRWEEESPGSIGQDGR
jgi:hypothetical protein